MVTTIMDFEELEAVVRVKAKALDEARRIYERTNIGARQIQGLRRAEDLLTIAEKNLRVARERQQRVKVDPRVEVFANAVQAIWPGAEIVRVTKRNPTQ